MKMNCVTHNVRRAAKMWINNVPQYFRHRFPFFQLSSFFLFTYLRFFFLLLIRLT